MPQREADLQRDIKTYLEARGWEVWNLHGNRYQKGLPDLYACHAQYGARWIEVKRPDRWSFTPDQKREFPRIVRCKIGIWVMQSVEDYPRLFDPPNIRKFLPDVKTSLRSEVIRRIQQSNQH